MTFIKTLGLYAAAASVFALTAIAAPKNTKTNFDKKKDKEMIAIFETNQGTFKVKLFNDKAPKTVQNFTELAEGKSTNPKLDDKFKGKHFYDGTIFHRVIPNFMIQGGDPAGNGTGGPGYTFADEFDSSLKFDKKGLLAMANRGPNTNGSQFFITVAATPWLNNRHTIFGEVTEGYDVVEKISNVPRDGSDKPNSTVTITKVTIQ